MTATKDHSPPPNGPIFISHASADDAFVRQLRKALEAQQHPVWVDSRNLRGGSVLNREIEQAIPTFDTGASFQKNARADLRCS